MKNIFTKIIGIMLVLILLVSTNIALAVTQSDIDKQKNQQSQISNQIDEAEEKQKELEAKKSEAQKQVESISSQIDNYESQIDDLDSQIDDANSKIKEAEEKLTQNQEEYEKKQEIFKQRLVVIYESGETSYLDVLLSSSSLTDFISNYYLVSELTEMDAQLMENLQKQKEEIENSKKEIETSKQKLTEAKASKESVANSLKTAKNEKDKYVSQLSEEEKKLEQEIQELKQANTKIAKEIKLAEEKYRKQLEDLKRQEQNGSSNGSNTTGSGYFMRPVSTGSISARGYYSSGKFHGAIDYAVPEGTPVYAAAAGVVMSTANLSGSYGTYVVIRHANGLQSYYAHGTYGSICVSPGQTVAKGQQIMKSGNTGNSTGAHLHFEVRKSPYSYNGYATAYGQDSRLNPENYM